jgi:hypothetical protein
MIELILGASGLGAAVAVPAGIEALKRPRLGIVPSPWTPAGPVAWTFAAVQIHNKPMGAPFNRLLTRDPAQGCVVDLDFFKWGTDERVMPTVPGRWSSHPEPIRSIPNPDPQPAAEYTGGTAILEPGWQRFARVYDATLSPREHDVAAGHAGEEVAVAILLPDAAYAFSTASYARPAWEVPEWKLDHGTYRVLVRVRGSSVERERAFKLEYLDNDFAKFALQPI